MSTMHTEAYPRLVADIGGTNARFALETAPQVIEKAEVLPCQDYDTIVDAAKTYLERAGSPKVLHAAFAIANPILGDWVQMTNHHWAFSIETTRQALGFETLILLNDFTAVSYTHLRAHETVLDLVCRLLLEKKHANTCLLYTSDAADE